MDRRDAMVLPGSASFYMQRGMTGSGSGPQPSLHGSPGMNPLSNPNVQFQSNVGGSTIGSTLPVDPSSTISPHGVNVGAPVVSQSEPLKRKRGRPRKYGPDGAVSLALSPSVSTHPGTISPTQKRGRGRPPGTGRKQVVSSLGDWLSGSAGMGFTPHIIDVAVGEDIATKLTSFSLQGPRAICILSANGAVSTATLRQPSNSSGTVIYEILCLSGSYLLTSNGGPHTQSGGLSVSLASPDGCVIGGGVGEMLIAASNVQVVVGSFLWGGSKTETKKGEASEGVRELEHQAVENQVTPTTIPPGQNLTQTSSVALWPGSRQMDMRNAHVDIDLMRG